MSKWYEISFCTTLWFCLMDRYRTISFAEWTGTGMFAFGSWQGTAGSQRLELTVANVGTTGYHCKELPVPRGWNSWFPTWEPPWNLRFPTWEPEVTIARNCRFPEVRTYFSRSLATIIVRNCRLRQLETHCSKPEKAYVTSGRICWFQKVKTHGS